MFIKQENQDNYRARFPNNTVNRHDCSITISLSLGSLHNTLVIGTMISKSLTRHQCYEQLTLCHQLGTKDVASYVLVPT